MNACSADFTKHILRQISYGGKNSTMILGSFQYRCLLIAQALQFDFCPLDPVGHIGEAYDPNVMELVRNALKDDVKGPEVCVVGFPGK